MNIREGTKRMRLLGMAMTLSPILAWMLYNVYAIQPTFSHSGFSGIEYHFSLRVFAAAVALAIPGAIVWAASWVIAGFAKETR